MKFYSQFGEDRYLYENGFLPKNGFYVDVGAGKPKENSNTYLLEQMGWSGVCIDADEKQVRELEKERNAHVIHTAVSDHEGRIGIDYHRFPELTRVSPTGKDQIMCTTLQNLLPGIRKIELLSIDVEGHEMEVLRGLDFKEYDVQIVIIEHVTHVDGDHGKEIVAFFEKLPYEIVHKTQSNLIFNKI